MFSEESHSMSGAATGREESIPQWQGEDYPARSRHHCEFTIVVY